MKRSFVIAPLLGICLIAAGHAPVQAERESQVAALMVAGDTASPALLLADRDPQAAALARSACKADDFDSFLVHLASAPPAAQRDFFARKVKVIVADRRGVDAPRPTVRKVPARHFAEFPVAMNNHHFVYARNGHLARDDNENGDGTPQFLRVTHERQTAILTDYPVRIVNVSWEKIRYSAPDPRRHEGEIIGAYGDSGRLLFAMGRSDCWELIDAYTTRQPETLRPAGGK